MLGICCVTVDEGANPAWVSADPPLNMDSSASLPSLYICCRKKFPPTCLQTAWRFKCAGDKKKNVLGAGGETATFLERHIWLREKIKWWVWRLWGWLILRSRDAGSVQLHTQRFPESECSLIGFGCFPLFSELPFHFSSILHVISYHLSTYLCSFLNSSLLFWLTFSQGGSSVCRMIRLSCLT